jgi:hypothetical protein
VVDAEPPDDESPDDELVSLEPLPPPPVDPESAPDPAAALSSFFDDEDEDDRPDAALDRSFLAQPEPLKWIVGGANAFVIVPSAPQLGQNLGPLSWIPWTTSVRWPQLLQT